MSDNYKKLTATNLCKTYSKRKVDDNVSIEVNRGEVVGLLGPNGAGKSTTLGIVSGLVQKSSGNAYVMGHDVNGDAFQARRSLGVVPQEFNFNQYLFYLKIIQIN